jgi:hypothetical protein
MKLIGHVFSLVVLELQINLIVFDLVKEKSCKRDEFGAINAFELVISNS